MFFEIFFEIFFMLFKFNDISNKKLKEFKAVAAGIWRKFIQE
ncbi:MAG: hypothetical protein FD170_3649 [Bacteroidetes bacterium]|nr:MAG: hypothetical protein FD170_3649 [Bacteroidota bacterium]